MTGSNCEGRAVGVVIDVLVAGGGEVLPGPRHAGAGPPGGVERTALLGVAVPGEVGGRGVQLTGELRTLGVAGCFRVEQSVAKHPTVFLHQVLTVSRTLLTADVGLQVWLTRVRPAIFQVEVMLHQSANMRCPIQTPDSAFPLLEFGY